MGYGTFAYYTVPVSFPTSRPRGLPVAGPFCRLATVYAHLFTDTPAYTCVTPLGPTADWMGRLYSLCTARNLRHTAPPTAVALLSATVPCALPLVGTAIQLYVQRPGNISDILRHIATVVRNVSG